MGHGASATGQATRRSPLLRLDQRYREEGWAPWPWSLPAASDPAPAPSDGTAAQGRYFGRNIPAPNGLPVSVREGGFFRPGLVFEGDPATAAEFLRELARRNGMVPESADHALAAFSSNGLRARMFHAADAGFIASLLGDSDIAFRNWTVATIRPAPSAPEDAPRLSIRYYPIHPMMAAGVIPHDGSAPALIHLGPESAPSDGDLLGIFEGAIDSLLMTDLHELAFERRSRAAPAAVADALAEALSMADAAGQRAADAAGTVLRAIPGEQPASLDIMKGTLDVGVSVTASWRGDLGITFYFDQLTGVFALHGELVREDNRVGIDWETAARGDADEPAPEAIRAFLSAMFAFEADGRGISGSGGPSGQGGTAGRTLTSEDAPAASGTIVQGAARFGGIVVVIGDDETGTRRGGDADADGASPLTFDATSLPGAADGIGVPLAPATPWATSPSAHPLSP